MWRRVGVGILMVVLALSAWAFAAGAIALADALLCAEANPTVESLTTGEDLECFDGSNAQRIAAAVLWAVSALVLAAAALAALAFSSAGATGGSWRGSRRSPPPRRLSRSWSSWSDRGRCGAVTAPA